MKLSNPTMHATPLKAAALAATIALAAVTLTCPAFADEATEDDGTWQPAFTVTTDKDAYAGTDQITVTATAVNDLDDYVEECGGAVEDDEQLEADIDLAIQIPEGYEVVSGEALLSAQDVAAGDSATTQVVLAKKDSATPQKEEADDSGTGSNAGSSSKASAMPKTGDIPGMVIAALAVAAALALAVAILCRRNGRRGADAANRLLCSLLSLVLVVGLAPAVASSSAYGDEGEAEADDDACGEHDTEGSVTVTVDGQDLTICATAEVDIYEGDHEDAYTPAEDPDDPEAEEAEDPRIACTITSAAISPDGSGYDVVMNVDASISQGDGTLDLTRSQVSLADAYVAGGSSASFAGTLQVTGATTIKVTRQFSAEDAQALIGDGDAAATLVPLAVYDFTQHALTVGQGALQNAAGEAMPTVTMHAIIGIDLDNVSSGANSTNLLTMEADQYATLAADDDSKTAEITADSFEIAEEVLDAIGEFVEAADEHPGDYFSGAGSILGVVAKTITTITGSSETYEMKDVISRLDSISASMDLLSSQVGTINTKLDNIDKKTDFRNISSDVASLVYNASCYQKGLGQMLLNVQEAAASKTSGDDAKSSSADTSTAAATNDAFDPSTLDAGYEATYTSIKNDYDKLSDEEKEILKGYYDATKVKEQTMGKGTVVSIATDLALYVTGQTTAGVYNPSNVYKSYFDYTAAFFNWETEVYEMRKAFVAQFNLAFDNAYCTAMNELSVEIATSTSKATIEADIDMRASLMKLSEQMKAIYHSDAVQSGLSPRSDGKVLNLVTQTLFDGNFAQCHFSCMRTSEISSNTDWAANVAEIQFVSSEVDITHTPLLSSTNYSQLSSDISSAQFTTMFENLGNVRGLSGYENAYSLLDEMIDVGLLPSNYRDAKAPGKPQYYETNKYTGYTWDTNKKRWVMNMSDKTTIDRGEKAGQLCSSSHLQVRNAVGNPYYFYISTNSDPKKITSKPSSEYINDYTGTVVDISATTEANLIKTDFVLYRLDHFFRAGHKPWYMQVTFTPVAVAKAAS